MPCSNGRNLCSTRCKYDIQRDWLVVACFSAILAFNRLSNALCREVATRHNAAWMILEGHAHTSEQEGRSEQNAIVSVHLERLIWTWKPGMIEPDISFALCQDRAIQATFHRTRVVCCLKGPQMQLTFPPSRMNTPSAGILIATTIRVSMTSAYMHHKYTCVNFGHFLEQS